MRSLLDALPTRVKWVEDTVRESRYPAQTEHKAIGVVDTEQGSKAKLRQSECANLELQSRDAVQPRQGRGDVDTESPSCSVFVNGA